MNLDYLAKEASVNFISNNIPLNDSIAKLAEDNALNRDQINRVVESANTSTYLSLFKKSDDKYIEFPVADSEKVAELLDKAPEDISELSDYDIPPDTELQDMEIFPVLEDAGVEKVSSVSDKELLNEIHKIQYADKLITEKLGECKYSFEKEAASLYDMVKQAVLSGESFGHIKLAMNRHLPGNITNKITEDFEYRLKHDDRLFNLNTEVNEKLASLPINEDSELLKQLTKVHEITDEYETWLDKKASVFKHKSVLSRAGKWAKGLAALGVLGIGATAGYQAGKSKAYEEQSVLKRKPSNYTMR
jgi:hypothetical protein